MLYNSSSPLGIIIIGICMSICGILLCFIGDLLSGIFLLSGGLFFIITILFLRKYYIPNKGVQKWFSPCKYGNEKRISGIQKKEK